MIELKVVSYKYKLPSGKEVMALDNVNLQIREGEYVAIIGANGSGKTTLARLFNCLLVPTCGEVLIDNLTSKDKNAQRGIQLKVGMVFQNPDNQIISTTVEREIAFGLENLSLPCEEMRSRVEGALEDFNLKPYRLHPPHRLSGGEKQRVSLASVLAMRPKYLVLDEPTSLLDGRGRKDFLNLLGKLYCQEMTLIHITQFPEEAMLAKRLLVLHGGKVVMDDSPSNVFVRVEDLEEIGLDVPLVFRMSNFLNKKSQKYAQKTLSVEEIAERIAQSIPDITIQDRKMDRLRDAVIKVEGLSFRYAQMAPDRRKILDDISFEIKSSDLVGMLGVTGSGKSTLAQHFNGLLKPCEGKVFFEGKDINSKDVDLKLVRRKVVLAFQFPELQLFEETVFDDIAFGPRNQGLDKDQIEKSVKNAMRCLGLDFASFAFRSPFSLSGGEQRMVAIAGILALNPEVLILDEPTVGLDPQNTKNLKSIIRNLNKNGMTIIVISHNLDLIAGVAQKILLLHQGRAVKYCSKQDFFEDGYGLEGFGLEIPPRVDLILKLKEKGVSLPEDWYDLEMLLEQS